jgi:dienelactone hydrolase
VLVLALGVLALSALGAAAAGLATGTGSGSEGARLGVSSPPPAAVGLRVLALVDKSRAIKLGNGGRGPRTLITYVRYPALAAPGAIDVRDAPPALGTADGPYPLIVFAHGFAVTPKLYARLLRSWARAGYVVAAPVFPSSRAGAPGGPDQADVVNQPEDVSFVISALLSRSRRPGDPLAGLIDPAQIAVAGHSDGGETALAAAYSHRFGDRRIDAAVVLAGAEMKGVGGYSFAKGGPALLAAQGTGDTSNEPRYTNAYFKRARRPKFLLRLIGAGHLPPYSRKQPQLGIVQRVTVAFLNRYLKREPVGAPRLAWLGDIRGESELVSDP